MNAYETSATVEEQGQLNLAGLPFAPGTEVEITIRPKARLEAGLCWEGNVLVHQGFGASPTLNELRDERLNRLVEGRIG
jgi:hypothetical protein